ncbi:MAG: hypothetical protein KAQ67_02585, partial [Gammaproteobacteria bacterium]|nr:hypothetical protein [Gammaproteobacteria bacterium]
MKKSFKKMSAQFIGAVLVSLFMLPAVADDIEIYIGNEGASIEVKPNLMFIIDTSGSMDADVESPLPYDINIDYKAVYGGTDVCFDESRVYFSTGSTPEDCNAADWFNKSELKCDASALPMFNTVAPTVVVDAPVEISVVSATTTAEDIEGTNTHNISSVYDDATQKTVAIDETTVVKITGTTTTTTVTHQTTTTTGPALGSGWYQDRIAQWKEHTDPTREEWLEINNTQK